MSRVSLKSASGFSMAISKVELTSGEPSIWSESLLNYLPSKSSRNSDAGAVPVTSSRSLARVHAT